MRWVGIDEAGYGPNLGPLVMTAVVAQSNAEGSGGTTGEPRSLDFWGDLAATVDRAGGDPDKLWVDDSKRIYHGGKGRDRLDLACLAAVDAVARKAPATHVELLATLGAGTLEEVELSRWLRPGLVTPMAAEQRARLECTMAKRALYPAHSEWRLTAIRSAIVGPARFNEMLAAQGVKSAVHFGAFGELVRWVWDQAADGVSTRITSDKHGGRHYYLPALSAAFPDAWIDRGAEGASLSRYAIRDRCRALEIRLVPRADQTDGLVALASLVSKSVRELWMDIFNDYWRVRLPGLRPTAGYPTDAQRFRREIDSAARSENCDPATWWRNK